MAEAPLLETAIVGLSPTYWSYVPLLIAQVNSLRILSGIPCMLLPRDEVTHSASKPAPKVVPLSRCRLVGCVVAVQEKPTGAVHYVIDDGTGLLDCIAWSDGYDDRLPPLLLPDARSPSDYHTTEYCVGDMVQVMGRIECVNAGLDAGLGSGHDRPFFELQISSIESLSSLGNTHRSTPNSVNVESQHIIDMASMTLDWQYPKRGLTTPDASPRPNQKPLLNASDVLEWLGPALTGQIKDRVHFPSTDDTVSAWKLFGVSCRCQCSTIKEELLYCHCIASSAGLDPMLEYRDVLLHRMLEWESGMPPSQQKPLFFQFDDLMQDPSLSTCSRNILASRYSPILAKQLLRQTIQALRNDGIVYLYHIESDTYLFITRRRILEPYIRLRYSNNCEDTYLRNRLRKCSPPFLEAVPKARLHLLQRTLHSEFIADILRGNFNG